MTALDLTKIFENSFSEIAWRGEKLCAWVNHRDIKDFCDTVGDRAFQNCEIESAILADGILWVNLNSILEYYDIDPVEILPVTE